MSESTTFTPDKPSVIDTKGLEALLAYLAGEGYRIVGPSVREEAVALGEIASIADLPAGWSDEQEAGRYRLRRSENGKFFDTNAPAQGWKQYLYPAVTPLWTAERKGGGFEASPAKNSAVDEPPLALFGICACDLAALDVLDRVLAAGPNGAQDYMARRAKALVVAVNCTRVGGTCFCASMGTGPRATKGYDLALTELSAAKGGQGHEFVAEAASERGRAALGAIPHRSAEQKEIQEARRLTDEAAKSMGRRLETKGLRDALMANLEHSHWEAVAQRCLTCANCTLACPTCFCHTIEDSTDIAGQRAERRRLWDSCFGIEYSYISGGSVRQSAMSRYRQWMTHKLATWVDQFGVFGCVGCGRCITWCPVGIDITEEARIIRENARPAAADRAQGAK